jgi:hypothetical protein
VGVVATEVGDDVGALLEVVTGLPGIGSGFVHRDALLSSR